MSLARMEVGGEYKLTMKCTGHKAATRMNGKNVGKKRMTYNAQKLPWGGINRKGTSGPHITTVRGDDNRPHRHIQASVRDIVHRGQLVEDWSSEVECPTWWGEELGDEIVEIDEQVVYELEVQFQKTCEGMAPYSKGYEDLDIEPLIERPKPFPEHEVEQEDRVTGVKWEEAPN
eukprot:Gb_23147 [translate_table: standard]